MKKSRNKAVEEKVRCKDCQHFRQDTDGLNVSAITGEYFMGICNEGCATDGPEKNFSDTNRVCQSFLRKADEATSDDEWMAAMTEADRIWEDMKYGRCAPTLEQSILEYEQKKRFIY